MNSKEKRAELKKITGVSISFMTVALLVSSFCSENKVERNILWAKSVEVHQETIVDAVSDPIPLAVEIPEKVQSGFVFDRNKMSDNYIVIPKQDSENGLATLTDEYVYRTIYIDITNKNDSFYDISSITRYAKDKKIVGEPEDLVLPPYLEAFIAGKSDASEGDMETYESIETGKKKQKKNDDPIVSLRLIKLDGYSLLLGLPSHLTGYMCLNFLKMI